MNLQIGNREKIAGLVILCLATIAVVHWFLVMGKAQAYREAYNYYNTQRARWSQLVSPDTASKIGDYEKDTQVMEDFLKELMTDLNIHFDTVRDYDETTTALAKKRLPALLDVIGQVCDLRTQQFKNVKLTFLDARPDYTGWDLPRPSDYERSLALWDQLSRLQNTVRMLDVMEPSPQRMALQQRYEAELAALRIVIQPNLVMLRELAGELVPTIKKIAHARLIWAQKEKDDKAAGIAVPIKTKEELDTLLKITYPTDPYLIFHYTKQLQFLLRLIKIADEQGIEEIFFVKLLPLRKVDQVTDPNTKMMRLVSEMHFDQIPLPPGYTRGAYGAATGWRPGMPGMPVVPGGAWAPTAPGWGAAPRGDYGDEEEGGYGRVISTATPADPLNPTPTPTPSPVEGGQWIGNAVPIRIGFAASYENALNFLYQISHQRNPFELDRMQMISLPGGKIQIDVTVAPMAWVVGLEGFYAPQGTTRPLTAMPLPPTPAMAATPVSAYGPARLGGGMED